jgi:hypothetical protein
MIYWLTMGVWIFTTVFILGVLLHEIYILSKNNDA